MKRPVAPVVKDFENNADRRKRRSEGKRDGMGLGNMTEKMKTFLDKLRRGNPKSRI